MFRPFLIGMTLWPSVAHSAEFTKSKMGQVILLDETKIRYFAQDAGSDIYAKFITKRELEFFARVETYQEERTFFSENERYERLAVQRSIVENMFSELQKSAGKDSPFLEQLPALFRAELEMYLGGKPELEKLANLSGISSQQLDTFLLRRALTAIYIDHIRVPFLQPTENELLRAFRTNEHPFHQQSYEKAKTSFFCFYIGFRLKTLELEMYEQMRSRVRIARVMDETKT